jgi:hypothetical protein
MTNGEAKPFVSSGILMNIMNVIRMKVPAKFVPAAAVTRMEQVLFILTRCKGLEGGYLNFL